ncbi:putative Zn-dependent protease [Desulfuromonas soudanensis]|uniref:Putative Zn-dependent protease n=1 Tax=Desulfuromonas soudanensis TaxID=1603606 RepID=A0A0M4DH30_9BACT|nr:metallopeptidase family protein [Desulfuromonas soudanensis]ALC16045.1 putative Zn-dependent protease [Desulfuromonas soudanensis]
MNRRTFEGLVRKAVAGIPDEFLGKVKNLSIQVEDWADPETLAEVGFDDPRDLLGYYRGWPLAERGHEYGNCLPDLIIIYQGAVEDYRLETGEPLLRIIRQTVVHELAHYFGFSEEEMDRIEDLWAGKEDAS